MDSNNPAKKRRADSESVPPRPGNDAPGAALPANLSPADLHRLIDQRVTDALEAVEAKTVALTSRVDGLQRENEELLLRCESLERSVQVLKKDGNWTYSAPDVPRSHWIDQGHHEDYAEEAEQLFRSIKNTTYNLRSGGDDAMFECETCILSDNALHPHWEQLANAIQLSDCIIDLNFTNVQLDQCALPMIAASVRQKGVISLYMDGNQFLGGKGVQFAADVLKNNREVERFSWCRNSFHSTADACALVDAVLEHPTLNEVSFTSSFRDGITTYLPVKRLFGGLGTDTLLEVDDVTLSNNGIKTNGDRCIPDFLSANPPLGSLYLDGNQLNDDDALNIALALQSNINLRCLDLRGNQLTERGKDVMYHQAILGQSISDIPGLESDSEVNLNIVSGANHTCEIYGISEMAFMNDSDKSAKLNRCRKLFWMLAERHRKGLNMTQIETEFSEDSLGVLPHVLACINTYATDYGSYGSNYNLSLLFELARDWKTPEMYQLHHS